MPTYTLHQVHPDIALLQRALNEIMGNDITPNGRFDIVTLSALEQYQRHNKIIDNDHRGQATYGQKTHDRIFSYIRDRFLTDDDYAHSANILGVSTPVMQAVVEVIRTNDGFYHNGTLRVAFERHLYYGAIRRNHGQCIADEMMSKYPDICSPTPGGHHGGYREHERFQMAKSNYEVEALLSVACGMFMLPGNIHHAVGYDTASEFYDVMNQSEAAQLGILQRLIQNDSGAHAALKRHDWTSFTRRYFGASSDQGNLGARLGNAYLKYSSHAN